MNFVAASGDSLASTMPPRTSFLTLDQSAFFRISEIISSIAAAASFGSMPDAASRAATELMLAVASKASTALTVAGDSAEPLSRIGTVSRDK